ncbi:MAG: hypothetical protein MMC23_000237 [Stictis urceolatum]|nr:hypothetical protein [Stictis urceolata]
MRVTTLICLVEAFTYAVLAETRSTQRRQDSSSILAGTSMRILPLGASITAGEGSSDSNGYRKDLLDMLVPPATIDYIGSLRNGTMAGNQHEGHSGFTIAEVGGQAPKSTPQRPNVILLQAGLNDVVHNDNLTVAPARLGTLVDQLFKACPDATVIVGNLIPNTDPTRLTRIKHFNAALPAEIHSRASSGAHVMLVDFFSALTTADLGADGAHPNDSGYMKMARVWYDAITEAVASGFIGAPVDVQQPHTARSNDELHQPTDIVFYYIKFCVEKHISKHNYLNALINHPQDDFINFEAYQLYDFFKPTANPNDSDANAHSDHDRNSYAVCIRDDKHFHQLSKDHYHDHKESHSNHASHDFFLQDGLSLDAMRWS